MEESGWSRDLKEYEDEKPWVMVKDMWLAKGVNAKQDVEVSNRFEVLAVETDMNRKMTRTSAIDFNVAEVRKPLASAARMVKNGNWAVLDQDGSLTENTSAGERMEVRVKDETFVFDVELANEESDVIILDSAAGVHVWPRGRCEDVSMIPKKEGLRMFRSHIGSSHFLFERARCFSRSRDFLVLSCAKCLQPSFAVSPLVHGKC